MSDATPTEPDQPSDRDRLCSTMDAVERVLRTHVAPVTGFEEEVALLLAGCDYSMTGSSGDREPG
jgi:hypothetical protein